VTNDDVCVLSLEAVAAEIAARRISPVELTRTLLDRIERLNPLLNAYITVTGEQALTEARVATDAIARGEYRGPLHGVPIAHKDLFATRGVRTTAGSKILAEWIPERDAPVVERLRAAGAISLGKLGMHEWACGITSDNPHFGAIRNPWDTERIPGGSSGGSGAAAAAALACVALGSDTAGSIRIPSHFCGCVGLMPTYGRVSLRDVVPLSWTLDHPGPLARTVRDCAIVLQAIAGPDADDQSTAHVPAPDYLAEIERGPKGLRVGLPRQHFWEQLDADVERLVRAAINGLEAAGAEIRETDFPDAQEWNTAATTILIVEAAAYHAPYFPSRKQDYGEDVARVLDAGAAVPGTAYVNARRALERARGGAADALLDGVDVLAVPTVPFPAPTIASIREGADATGRGIALTALFDLTGQPVLTVPCGLTSAQLPVGVSFVARQWDEATLLRAGRAYEQVRGAFPLPPIAVPA